MKQLRLSRLLPWGVGILLLLISVPRFFDLYRTLAFNTVPHDDYASYLLSLAGAKSGVPMNSPSGYRLFSVLLALPFYRFAPVYQFSNLNGADPTLLRANQALAAVSYLSILAACAVIYLISARRLRLPDLLAWFAALVAYLLFDFTSSIGVDPLAILLICLLVYFLERPLPFALLILLSVGFNEKVSLVLLLFTASRLVFQRREFRLRWQLAASLAAVALYFAIRQVVRLPGFENQTSLAAFWPSFVQTMRDSFSAKGAVLNLLPLLILGLLYGLACLSAKPTVYFDRTDVAGFAAFILLAIFVRLEFTLGRVLMYCFPLFLPSACASLAALYTRSGGPEPLT